MNTFVASTFNPTITKETRNKKGASNSYLKATQSASMNANKTRKAEFIKTLLFKNGNLKHLPQNYVKDYVKRITHGNLKPSQIRNIKKELTEINGGMNIVSKATANFYAKPTRKRQNVRTIFPNKKLKTLNPPKPPKKIK